jgi:outer membrane biosynthesis protein TonB
MIDLRLIKAKKPVLDQPTKNKQGLPLAVSIIFHFVILLIVLIGLPFVGKKIIDSPHVVVEIMPIAKENNLNQKRAEELKPKFKEAPKSSPAPAVPEPKPEEVKPKIAEEKPLPPKPKEEKKQEPLKPVKKAEEKKRDKKSKPEEKKILDKKKIDDYESLLKNLSESSEKKNDIDNKSQNHSKINDYDQNKALSITTENAIKRQLYGCWSPPSGAKNAREMAVVVRIKFAPDGSVIEASHVDRGIFTGNHFYNAAVAAALRAVWKCSPLQIPKNEYDNWKEIEFNFDPSSIIY